MPTGQVYIQLLISLPGILFKRDSFKEPTSERQSKGEKSRARQTIGSFTSAAEIRGADAVFITSFSKVMFHED